MLSRKKGKKQRDVWDLKTRKGERERERERGNSYLSEPSVCDCLRFSRVIGREWFAVHRSIAKKTRADPFLYGCGASGESRLDKQGCQTDVSALWGHCVCVRAATGRFSSRKLARNVCHGSRSSQRDDGSVSRPKLKTFQRPPFNWRPPLDA